MYENSYIRQDKIWKINQTSLKLKQLQMTHKLKYNQQRNVLNQLNELEQLKEQLVCLSNELSLLTVYVREPKLMFQLILASKFIKKEI